MIERKTFRVLASADPKEIDEMVRKYAEEIEATEEERSPYTYGKFDGKGYLWFHSKFKIKPKYNQ